MKLTQIFFQNQNTLNCYVNYENKLLPRYVFEDDIHKKIFQKHTESIMLKVEEAISEYVNCENLCNDDEGMFPQPDAGTRGADSRQLRHNIPGALRTEQINL